MTYEIHIGSDVYYCEDYEYKRDGEILMLECKPSNGYAKGQLHKFPVYRVDHIVSREDPTNLAHDRFLSGLRANTNLDLVRDMERGK